MGIYDHSLLKPGDVFGDYTVVRLLGMGGMGAVYLLRSPGDNLYAAKIMYPDAAKQHDFRRRFVREAEFAMKLRHENLVSVYDVGEDPDTGLCYILMEYVSGGSLADRLEQSGSISVKDSVAVAICVAKALAAAHGYGLVHRDVKPDNILFTADGVPKLADLGVAKFEDRNTTVTTTGMVIGTPAYMAPEQMIDPRNVDARADIYSLGLVLYEMLTGKRPNEGSSVVELLAKAIKGEPLPDVRTMRPEISASIAQSLSFMCAPKPEDRPQTSLETVQLLQDATTDKFVLPEKPPREDRKSKKRRVSAMTMTTWLLVLSGLVSIGLCGRIAWRRHEADRRGRQMQIDALKMQVMAEKLETEKARLAAEQAKKDLEKKLLDAEQANREIETRLLVAEKEAADAKRVAEEKEKAWIAADKVRKEAEEKHLAEAAARNTETASRSEPIVAKEGDALRQKCQLEKLYMVVDLTKAGKKAVSYLDEAPKDGWGDEYRTKKMVFRRIEPGSFEYMPDKSITITKPFYIGIFEVTQKQYEKTMNSNPSQFKGDMRPVDGLSYIGIRGTRKGLNWPADSRTDGDSYLGKLRRNIGLEFELPTEAQWEYACRAGTKGDFNVDGVSVEELGKCVDNGGRKDQHVKVGSFLPNAWGLYDMHGNVWEWCADRGQDGDGVRSLPWAAGAKETDVDPKGPATGESRILRGGSWDTSSRVCRSSARFSGNASLRWSVFGVRLVCPADAAN